MKRLLFLLCAATVTCAWAQVLTLPANGWRQGDRLTRVQVEYVCPDDGGSGEEPSKEEPRTVVFAKGADLGWITEMEAKGYKFYTKTGVAIECTALMKSLGLNSVRYRVWVNPANGYNI